MRNWKLLLGLAVIFVAAIVLTACAPKVKCEDPLGCVELAKGEPIKIASALVISGPDASLGLDSQYGVEVAIADKGGKLKIKDAKGKVTEVPIQLVKEDDGCSAEGGQAAGLKITADKKIAAVVGTSCSSAARNMIPLVTKAGMVMVSPSNTAPDLTATTRSADYAGYLRVAHSDAVQGKVAAEFAFNVIKAKKAAAIHDGSLYSESLAKVFADEFKKLGGTITNFEAVDPKATDVKPVLKTIAANKPEFIYHPVFVQAGANIIAQSKQVAGVSKIPTMGADGMFSEDVVKAAGKAAVGVYLSSPDLTAFTAGYTKFKETYKKMFGKDPLSIFHAHAYDSANIIFNAIEKVAVAGGGGKILIPRGALRKAIYATKDHAGLTGKLNCNQYGDCSNPVIAVYQIKTTQGFSPEKVYPTGK